MPSEIEFSAQFGGRDAAQAVLPHFQALKAVSRGRTFEGFPARIFSFILRVDGSTSRYGLSGACNLEVDARLDYISVDIGVLDSDRERLASHLAASIRAGLDLIASARDSRLVATDFGAAAQILDEVTMAYLTRVGGKAQ